MRINQFNMRRWYHLDLMPWNKMELHNSRICKEPFNWPSSCPWLWFETTYWHYFNSHNYPSLSIRHGFYPLIMVLIICLSRIAITIGIRSFVLLNVFFKMKPRTQIMSACCTKYRKISIKYKGFFNSAFLASGSRV